MGLFGKGKKGDNNQLKREKDKKKKKGRKGKNLSLVERMQLEESVAEPSLDLLKELLDEQTSAVRELDEGYLLVAITNEDLEHAELDPSSEEFGSFAEGLRNETIESITLENDLVEGVIGIIPSIETLTELDSFDFVQNIEFRWAIMPFDADDESKLILLNEMVPLSRLIDLANDQAIHFRLEGDCLVELDYNQVEGSTPEKMFGGDDEGEYQPFEDDGVMDDEDDESFEEDDTPAFAEDEDEPYEPSFDEPSESSDFEDEGEFEFESEADDDLSDNDAFEFDGDGENEDDEDEFPVDEEDSEPIITAEETQETVRRVTELAFHNEELGLKIDTAVFDEYFDSTPVAKFDTSIQNPSDELERTIVQLRKDANAEIERYHDEHIKSLRNQFVTDLQQTYNRLVDIFDHRNETTQYGEKFKKIERRFEDAMDELDRLVSNRAEQIQERYNKEREEFAETAYRNALVEYDSRYKDGLEKKLEAIREEIKQELKTDRDVKISELYKDRRVVAKRLFDKAINTTLAKLRKEYDEIAKKELSMFDSFRKNMDAYLRKHYADEVLRAKAMAETLRQEHEAERVRREYNQMLKAKEDKILELDEQMRSEIDRLSKEHKEQLHELKKEYEERLERERKRNEDLSMSLSKLSEEKDREVEHRLKVMQDQLQAKEKELEYANERSREAQKPMKYITIAIGVIAIAVGLIIGFLMGANHDSKELAPASYPQQGDNTTSYLHQEDILLNYQFNDRALL